MENSNAGKTAAFEIPQTRILRLLPAFLRTEAFDWYNSLAENTRENLQKILEAFQKRWILRDQFYQQSTLDPFYAIAQVQGQMVRQCTEEVRQLGMCLDLHTQQLIQKIWSSALPQIHNVCRLHQKPDSYDGVTYMSSDAVKETMEQRTRLMTKETTLTRQLLRREFIKSGKKGLEKLNTGRQQTQGQYNRCDGQSNAGQNRN